MAASLSPMMEQYESMKKKYPNTVLFFRLGDFYEMFFEDAEKVSKELELTLTSRACGNEKKAPMCGVPYHSSEAYIARLVAKGYKVAICEQTEDPATAKGIVKRDVVRVVTPGTLIEGSMLDEMRNNYIASLFLKDEACGICFADVSTGDLQVTELSGREIEALIQNELSRFMPSEILINEKILDLKELQSFIKQRLNASVELLTEEEYDLEEGKNRLSLHFGQPDLRNIGFGDSPLPCLAVDTLLEYLKRTQMSGLERICTVNFYKETQFMRLDLSTRRNLELLETMRNKEHRGSLLWVLDQTKTAMGKRMIRMWIEKPLLSCAQIIGRQNAVTELFSDTLFRAEAAECLSGMNDLERLMTRIVYGSANARELRALASALSRLPALKTVLENVSCNLLREIYNNIDPLEDIFSLIDASIAEEPPITVREGGLIKAGYSEEVDLLHADMSDGKGFIARVEEQERKRTGIPKLKVGYNRVFGYYIEVTNSYKSQVPEEYIRKQTISNGERYITEELKRLEGRVLGAQERAVQLEYKLFEQIRLQVAGQLNRIQTTAEQIAQLDVLISLAETASRRDYVCPSVNQDGRIFLKESRHPVVEAILTGAPFVPNDVSLDREENRVAIITGPNMAGKSTYMRQAALIVLMAQIGSFVPCAAAEIGIVDSIFTRVGASDDLASGQSTFMVEMVEVAHILKHATAKSLLILDEIGRGTSTFDGMSIARAVLEFAAEKKKLGAKTLFATHYHELSELEGLVQGVKNYNIAVKKRGDDITFLRRIVRGGADDSYGIEVAKLAGVPESVVRRAKQVLKVLEDSDLPGETAPKRQKAALPEEPEDQVSFAPSAEQEILEKLKTMDVTTLTPIEAMNALFDMINKLNS